MKKLQTILALVILFVLTIPTFAIENAPVEGAPRGVALLLLFMGVGAMVLVGFVMFARERNDANSEAPESH